VQLAAYYSGITNRKFHKPSKEFTSRDIYTNCLHETNNTYNNIYLRHDVAAARVFVHVNQPSVCTVQKSQTRHPLALYADISVLMCGSNRRRRVTEITFVAGRSNSEDNESKPRPGIW
jgi:hypothetical protein